MKSSYINVLRPKNICLFRKKNDIWKSIEISELKCDISNTENRILPIGYKQNMTFDNFFHFLVQ